MFIEIGAAAEAADGPCGRVGAVMLLRDEATLTHLVIDHRGHGATARVVPATAIDAPRHQDVDLPDPGGCRLSWTRDEVDAATEADTLRLVEVSHASGAGPLNPSGALPGIMSLAHYVGEGPDDAHDGARTRAGDTGAGAVATSVHRDPPGTVRIDGSTPVVDVDEHTLGTVTGLRFAPDGSLVGVVARPHGLKHELHHDLVEYPTGPDQHPQVAGCWIRFDLPGDEVVRLPVHR